MKGFKKDGKFIPTGNKNNSSLKKDDVIFPVREGGHTVELTGSDAEEYIKKRFPDYDISKLPPNLRSPKRDKESLESWDKLPSKTKTIADDWWMAISEGGLGGDIMNVSDVYPSTVDGYESGDPIAFDEFTDAEKMKLINRAGGESGMIEKIADEWQLDEDEVDQRYG